MPSLRARMLCIGILEDAPGFLASASYNTCSSDLSPAFQALYFAFPDLCTIFKLTSD